jgi:hypothetical protein
MPQDVSTEQLVEVAVVCAFGAAFYLSTLLVTCFAPGLGCLRKIFAVLTATFFFISSSACCVLLVVKQRDNLPHTLPFHIWRGAIALSLSASEVCHPLRYQALTNLIDDSRI